MNEINEKQEKGIYILRINEYIINVYYVQK